MGTSTTEPLNSRLFCSECGRPFPPEDLARFGPAAVCGDCKPNYVQRMREGVPMTGGFSTASGTAGVVYGGFWRRFAAISLDGIILGIPFCAIVLMFGLTALPAPNDAFPGSRLWLILLAELGFFAVSFAYFVYFNSQKGATPGKMALGLKIVTATGGPITVGRAVGRYFAHSLSGMILYIGFIMAAFDDQKRALHDHICSTRVIRD